MLEKTKQELVKEFLKDCDENQNNQYSKDYHLVASTRTNRSYSYLYRKLYILNAIINRKFLKRHYQKSNNRILFFCFFQKATNNTHSHLVIRVPSEILIKDIIDLMKEKFSYLDDRKKTKFEIHSELTRNVNDSLYYKMRQIKDSNFTKISEINFHII